MEIGLQQQRMINVSRVWFKLVFIVVFCDTWLLSLGMCFKILVIGYHPWEVLHDKKNNNNNNNNNTENNNNNNKNNKNNNNKK